MRKLWGGRFKQGTAELVDQFCASLPFDWRLYRYDIAGSIVHARMLARSGIIEQGEGQKIVEGLEQIKQALEAGELAFDQQDEDIHSFVENRLIELIGPLGGKLHTARSRNDQVALDLRLYLRDEIKELQNGLLNLLKTLLAMASVNLDVIMPGYTHLQRAQAVTLAHHLLAYYFMFKRDYQRLQDNLKRVNVLPLGSAALAGTSFPIDREWVAEELGFPALSLNSLDAVSDRDYLIEFLAVAATVVMHLSRLSEELILWASSEFNFIELDDAYATGSSIMPQKKNPDVAELTRGKSGRIYGHLLQLLTTLKGLPLAYNKDLQEDKEGVFDTVDTLKVILKIFPAMLATLKINKGEMAQAATKGFLNATDLADYLASKGLPFRQAHEVVGRAVLYSLEKGIELEMIPLASWHRLFPEIQDYISEDLAQHLLLKNTVYSRRSLGGTSPEENHRVIEKEKVWLDTEYA